MDECTSKCRSRNHARTVFSAITLSKEHEEKVLKYLQLACHNAVSNRDPEGRSALHHAASLGRMKIIDWLVSNDAQTSLKDDESGYSPLHRAAYFGRLNAVRYLSGKCGPTLQLDNDNLTFVDHFIRDRLPGHGLHSKQLSEAYVWGSNSNYTLGLSGQQSRNVPELLDIFRKENAVQVVMSKFHTVFITQSGQIYSCGHGHGGRLGQDTEHAIITPRKLKPIIKSSDPECCMQAAVGMDHSLFLMESGTVWSCGMNQFHQLGHNPPPAQLLTPKCIASLNTKSKSIVIRGICASRFHSVFWSSDSVYTCGINGGQLGHLKGDKTIVLPKQVTSFSAKELTITHVAASDGATAVCTHKGDVYVLHEYQCRKIASKQFELEKIVMIGGNLEQFDLLSETVATKLQVILLMKSGKIFVWSESNPVLTRCLFRLGRQLIIKDVSLNNSSMLLVSQEGEAFSGTLIHRSNRKVETFSPSTGSKSWIEFAKAEQCDQIKIKRIPGICRAVAASSDPEGKNFAVIQNHPSVHMVNVPEIYASQIHSDYKQLIDEVDLSDGIHDLIFQVGKQQFAAHRFIISSRQEAFYRQVCETQLNNNPSGVVSVTGLSADVFQLILEFIYAGSGSILDSTAGSARFQKLSAVQVTDSNLNTRPAKKYVTDNKKNNDRKNKKPESSGDDASSVKIVQNGAKKLGIESLAKMLDKVKLVNNRVVTTERIPPTALSFDRASGREFYDVRIRSEDGKVFDAHRVVLSARLEYFRAMFSCGWIETDSDRILSLPVHSSVLEVVLDFLYEDRAVKIEKADDVEFVGNVLVAADQLLISRLVSICESALVALLTLKNVGQILEFADIYNAPQLKTACMHFICLNLPAIAELRVWDACSERIMDELTDYYRNQFHPAMAYRCITPSSLAPSIEELESLLSTDYCTEPTFLANLREEAKRQRTRRKSSRKSSECKERLLSTSSINSVESFDGELLAPVEPVVKQENWSIVGKIKKANKSASEDPTCDPIEEFSTPRKTQGTPTKTRSVEAPNPETVTSPPKQPFPTLYEVAFMSQAMNSPPKSQQSKKFPKLSQKQRKSQSTAANPSTPEPPAVTSPWKVTSQSSPSACFTDILKEDDATLKPPGSTSSSAVSAALTPLQHIMDSELEQKRNMVRLTTKPLKLTLVEEEAMDDLRRFYQVEDCHDEWITVERVAKGLVATPVWKANHN